MEGNLKMRSVKGRMALEEASRLKLDGDLAWADEILSQMRKGDIDYAFEISTRSLARRDMKIEGNSGDTPLGREIESDLRALLEHGSQ
ncbi:MAG: hypothetical protein KGH72_03400 [Candidatus Micrarchaeota archaeon]|nr:hypothetical protein [Candidatus Micrarchaeota archaeon]